MSKKDKPDIMSKRAKVTFTKKCVAFILIVAMIDLQFSYFLAFIGKENIAETLSITICTEIIGVMLGYFLKSYFETKQEKKHELEEKKLDLEEEDSEEDDDYDYHYDKEEVEGIES